MSLFCGNKNVFYLFIIINLKDWQTIIYGPRRMPKVKMNTPLTYSQIYYGKLCSATFQLSNLVG